MFLPSDHSGTGMSEFKYACPVCGQHIKCDSSQAGSVMDCPTCFQKITVPQAPASDDQKFILTGSKVTEKKTSVPATAGGVAAPEKKFPAAVVLVLLLGVGPAGGAGFCLPRKDFPNRKTAAKDRCRHQRRPAQAETHRPACKRHQLAADARHQRD